jgi:maltodextrin utilization protein YvdJ
LHFLCLAYLAAALFKGREHILKSKLAAPFVKTGQQSLSVFLSSMALSVLAGMALDVIHRNIPTIVLVNGAGIGILMLIAYLIAWFKSQPWRAKARQ